MAKPLAQTAWIYSDVDGYLVGILKTCPKLRNNQDGKVHAAVAQAVEPTQGTREGSSAAVIRRIAPG